MKNQKLLLTVGAIIALITIGYVISPNKNNNRQHLNTDRCLQLQALIKKQGNVKYSALPGNIKIGVQEISNDKNCELIGADWSLTNGAINVMAVDITNGKDMGELRFR